MTFKCKMCGGTLEFKTGDTVATCDSCGTLQTLPKMDDEHRTNLYDRANHYRRASAATCANVSGSTTASC